MQNKYLLLLVFLMGSFFTARAQLDMITQVNLTFTPAVGNPVTASATDNGSGLVPDGPILLMESTSYTLNVSLLDGSTDITSTVSDNGNQYQLFFQPGGSIISGDLTATDNDNTGLPIGLENSLTSECTGDGDLSGMLRVVLADLGDDKSASSSIGDGTNIFDLNWDVTLVDDPQAPPCENEEEVITDVILSWIPTSGGDTIVARAQDPDGEGPLDLIIDGPINLDESTDYNLTIEVRNEIEGEDITEEIREEDEEHMFFFAWTDEVFRSPAGDGNIDNRMDPVDYQDFDSNGLPLGLSTNWTTECTETNTAGTFRLVLKHQPDSKSASSTVDDGGTDIDLTWTINVVDDPDAPACENEEEIITDVILSWVPTSGGDTIVARAQDPDGEGPLDLIIDGPINLDESTDYNLTIEVRNEIEGEDITEEIREEDEEHMFFFAWTDEVFRSPAGDGNIDNRMDPVDYQDADSNGLPLGLSTNWTTECTETNTAGTFRLVLKHQPDSKSASSTVDDGGTDIDLTWTINVVDDPDAPACENEEEIITDVILSWIPISGGDTIVARAQDPDGEGPLDLIIDGPINLDESTDYNLTIEVRNEIEGEDITEEIREEDEEHMFFFAWTEGIFSNPGGDGNIDMRGDAVNYNDQDANGLPVGLSTAWTTAAQNQSGTFRLVLKHQPDSKSASSTVDDGGTDIDLTWTINTVVTSTRQQAITNQELQLFPNPAQDQLNWRLQNTPVQAPEIHIMDSFGRVVRYYANPTVSIPISDLPRGTYLLQAKSGNRVWIQRFVKL